MGKIKTVELSLPQRAALEHGYRESDSHAFRVRCRMVLLKSECRTSAEIADVLGCCEVVVNNWLKRFHAHGIDGLRTRAGRGRKPILDVEADLPRVTAAVAANRQRISVARAALEVELGKAFSTKTLERYIKTWCSL